jgi:hypothetical protein
MPSVRSMTLKHEIACSEKSAFLTKDEAKRARHRTRKTSGRNYGIYRCPVCHCWHFTSKKDGD